MKYIVYCLLIIAFLPACSDREETAEVEIQAEMPAAASLQNTEKKALVPEIDPAAELPGLFAILKAKPAVWQQLFAFAKPVLEPTSLQNESQLIALFEARDALIPELIEPVIDAYFSVYKENVDNWKTIEDELQRIGLQVIYAEGMPASLGESALLEDRLQAIGSEEFRWYLAYKTAEADASGSEYPYIDLTANMKALEIAEKILEKYPDGVYFKKMKEQFSRTIMVFTDVHRVNGEHESYIIGDMNGDYYPAATEIENHQKFISEYPNSRFNSLIKNILATLSNINPERKEVYVVLVGEAGEYETARLKITDYLLENKDVPHLVRIKKGEQFLFAPAHRYYAGKQKAETALGRIKKQFPEAVLVKINRETAEILPLD